MVHINGETRFVLEGPLFLVAVVLSPVAEYMELQNSGVTAVGLGYCFLV